MTEYTISMLKQYEVMNIKCGGCATTVTDKLKDRFSDITVNLETEPRIVSATVATDEDETYLLETLRSLGYPLKTDELSKITEKYLYGKSYVSCMHGKVSAKNK